MFKALIKGFRYTQNPFYFQFSSLSAKQLLNSLFSLPKISTNLDSQSQAIPIIRQLKPNLHELNQEEIFNLAGYTTYHNLQDPDFSVFFAKNFKTLINTRSLSLKDLAQYLSLIGKIWDDKEIQLISDYIESLKADITPNTVSLLLASIDFPFKNREIEIVLEQKAIEFVPYMNIGQLEHTVHGMAKRSYNSPDFWTKVENKLLAQFLLLSPKDINSFSMAFLGLGKGSDNFWKLVHEAMEIAAENYQNLHFFFPYLGKSKAGSPQLWAKYEKNLEGILPKITDFDLLANIQLLTASEKGSFEIYHAINETLEKKLPTFDLQTCFYYVATLIPFERMIIREQFWIQMSSRVKDEYDQLDAASQGHLQAIMEEAKNAEKESEREGVEVEDAEEEEPAEIMPDETRRRPGKRAGKKEEVKKEEPKKWKQKAENRKDKKH